LLDLITLQDDAQLLESFTMGISLVVDTKKRDSTTGKLRDKDKEASNETIKQKQKKKKRKKKRAGEDKGLSGEDEATAGGNDSKKQNKNKGEECNKELDSEDSMSLSARQADALAEYGAEPLALDAQQGCEEEKKKRESNTKAGSSQGKKRRKMKTSTGSGGKRGSDDEKEESSSASTLASTEERKTRTSKQAKAKRNLGCAAFLPPSLPLVFTRAPNTGPRFCSRPITRSLTKSSSLIPRRLATAPLVSSTRPCGEVRSQPLPVATAATATVHIDPTFNRNHRGRQEADGDAVH